MDVSALSWLKEKPWAELVALLLAHETKSLCPCLLCQLLYLPYNVSRRIASRLMSAASVDIQDAQLILIVQVVFL
jgi:hypothetical protein